MVNPNSNSPRVLIADDQQDVLQSLRLLLKPEGYDTALVDAPGAVLAAAEKRDFDVVLIDLNYARDTTSGEEGLDLLSSLQKLDATLPVVVMTAWARSTRRSKARSKAGRWWPSQVTVSGGTDWVATRMSLARPSTSTGRP